VSATVMTRTIPVLPGRTATAMERSVMAFKTPAVSVRTMNARFPVVVVPREHFSSEVVTAAMWMTALTKKPV